MVAMTDMVNSTTADDGDEMVPVVKIDDGGYAPVVDVEEARAVRLLARGGLLRDVTYMHRAS